MLIKKSENIPCAASAIDGVRLLKLLSCCLLLFTISTAVSSTCLAATYYLDASAAGANDGTSWTDAWTSLDSAYTWSTPAVVQEGDTVLIRNGSYGTFQESTNADGESRLQYRSDWVTYKADSRHSPIFSDIDIYQADKWGTEIDYCETPWTAGSGDTVTADAGVVQHGSKSCKIELQSEAANGDKLAYINIGPIDTGNKIDGLRFYVRSDAAITAGDYEIVVSESADGAKTGTYAVFECDAVVADTWAETTIQGDLTGFDAIASVAIYANATIANGTTIYVDRIRSVGEGNAYLKFDDITITEGTTSLYYVGYVQLLNCTLTYPAEVYTGAYSPYYDDGKNIYMVGVDNITIDNCIITGGYNGIYSIGSGLRLSSDITITNSTINTTGEDALKTVANNLTIRGNTIGPDINRYHVAVNIIGTVSNPLTEGEVVTQAGTNATGIFRKQTGSYSKIWTTSTALFKKASEGGGIITGATSGETISTVTYLDPAHSDCLEIHTGAGVFLSNVIIDKNIFLRTPDTSISPSTGIDGIKFGSGGGGYTDGIEITNNIISAPKSVLLGNTRNCIINNNTCYGNTYFILLANNGTPERFQTTVNELYNNIIGAFRLEDDIETAWCRVVAHGNNIFGNDPRDYNGGPTYTFAVDGGTELVNYNIDSLFVDVANNDFRLAEGSVAIDFGDAAHNPNTDILGNARDANPDAGCYEYGASLGNQAPIADAGSNKVGDQALIDSDGDGEEAILDGSASYDSDGTIVSWVWTDDHDREKTIPDGEITTVSLSVGTHSITLTVTDNNDLSATDKVNITVEGPKISSSETRLKNVIDISFNSSLDKSLVEDPNNYTINYTVNAAEDSIVVHNVSLDPNLNMARLFTSTHSEDVEYTLKADFIQDEVTYTSNLVGDWGFDEYSGLEAKDSSCKGNTATLVNGPAWTGLGDLSFDGNDDAVEISTAGLEAGQGTISLWAYAEDLNGVHYLFSHLDQDDNSAIQLYTIGAQLCLSLGAKLPDYVALNIESLVPQAWYNIALTWDGTNYTVYVDGIAKISGPYDGLTAMNTFADVGNDGNNRINAFNGVIDDVKIYNLALNADAVSDIFFSEEVKENKNLAFVIDPMDDLTYSVQNQQDLPEGAVFDPDSNTFTWKPWFDQAGGCEITFEGVDGSEYVQDTLTITAVVEDIELSSWYEQWLRHIGLL